jgi:hypothetical protein
VFFVPLASPRPRLRQAGKIAKEPSTKPFGCVCIKEGGSFTAQVDLVRQCSDVPVFSGERHAGAGKQHGDAGVDCKGWQRRKHQARSQGPTTGAYVAPHRLFG